MERVTRTYQFGPHRVDVLEVSDDEGVAGYEILVDDVMVTDPTLDEVPDLETVVHAYARSRERVSSTP